MYDHLKEQEKKSQEQRRLEKANQPKTFNEQGQDKPQANLQPIGLFLKDLQ